MTSRKIQTYRYVVDSKKNNETDGQVHRTAGGERMADWLYLLGGGGGGASEERLCARCS